MSVPTTSVIRESLLAGPVPRYEIPGWRERFGVVAGITARGGESGQGFDLGLWTDEPVGEVMTRWRAFRSAEAGFGSMVLGHQVHKADVAWHDAAGRGWTQIEGYDGHATAAPGLLLTVTVADCIPIYLAAPRQRAVALLHSGWRGTAAGILARGVESLVEHTKCNVSDIVMHCGVGICGSCYEVGSEVMDGCARSYDGAGPWHIDLREVLAQQGETMGLSAVSTSQWCSSHDRPRFYSHRASGGRDGRMVAYIGIPLGAGETGV
ncbi:MAG: polyphenol oxidase family protein [Gemmatimonadota bacterium]